MIYEGVLAGAVEEKGTWGRKENGLWVGSTQGSLR